MEEIKLCKCGCGKNIEFKFHHKYRNIQYIHGHNSINFKERFGNKRAEIIINKMRNKKQIELDKTILLQYISENKSCVEIAKLLNTTTAIVYNNTKRYSIKLQKYRWKKGQEAPKHNENCKCWRCNRDLYNSRLQFHNLIDEQKDMIVNLFLKEKNLKGVYNILKDIISYRAIKKCLKERNINVYDYRKQLMNQRKEWIEKISTANNERPKEVNLKISDTLKEYFKNPRNREIIKEARKNQITPIKDTKIEIKIQNYLKELNIEFFTHQYIDIEHGYQCDIFIPVLKLVIECDGIYWHHYPTGTDLDKIRTQELIEKGFKVLRLWESEINIMTIVNFKNKLGEFR